MAPRGAMLSKLIQYLRTEGGAFLGVIGAVMAVYSALQDVVTLSAWAEAIVTNFTAVTTWLWAQALFWLPSPIRPLDATILNLAAFMVLFVVSSLAHGKMTPRTLAEVDWKGETAANIGILVAVIIIIASSASAVMATQNSDTYRALLDKLAMTDPGPAREAAAHDFLAHISAFIGLADRLAQYLGFGVGQPILIRLDTIIRTWFAMMLLVFFVPPVAIELVARALGYGRDPRRAARHVWRFNLACLLVLALNGVSILRGDFCGAPAPDGAIAALCRLL